MALAAALHSLTTRRRIETIIAVTAQHASFVLIQKLLTPAAGDTRLLPLTRAANRNAAAGVRRS
jgi:hypothetical protein